MALDCSSSASAIVNVGRAPVLWLSQMLRTDGAVPAADDLCAFEGLPTSSSRVVLCHVRNDSGLAIAVSHHGRKSTDVPKLALATGTETVLRVPAADAVRISPTQLAPMPTVLRISVVSPPDSRGPGAADGSPDVEPARTVSSGDAVPLSPLGCYRLAVPSHTISALPIRRWQHLLCDVTTRAGGRHVTVRSVLSVWNRTARAVELGVLRSAIADGDGRSAAADETMTAEAGSRCCLPLAWLASESLCLRPSAAHAWAQVARVRGMHETGRIIECRADAMPHADWAVHASVELGHEVVITLKPPVVLSNRLPCELQYRLARTLDPDDEPLATGSAAPASMQLWPI